MPEHRPYNVLFLCTGNSARSIMAESILNKDGAGHFKAFSAGSNPKSEVNPLALETLRQLGYPAEGLRAKSWHEFAAAGAPAMDFVLRFATTPPAKFVPRGLANR
jgi:arsenate reductase